MASAAVNSDGGDAGDEEEESETGFRCRAVASDAMPSCRTFRVVEWRASTWLLLAADCLACGIGSELQYCSISATVYFCDFVHLYVSI
eukprot:s1452_g10.t1